MKYSFSDASKLAGEDGLTMTHFPCRFLMLTLAGAAMVMWGIWAPRCTVNLQDGVWLFRLAETGTRPLKYSSRRDSRPL